MDFQLEDDVCLISLVLIHSDWLRVDLQCGDFWNNWKSWNYFWPKFWILGLVLSCSTILLSQTSSYSPDSLTENLSSKFLIVLECGLYKDDPCKSQELLCFLQCSRLTCFGIVMMHSVGGRPRENWSGNSIVFSWLSSRTWCIFSPDVKPSGPFFCLTTDYFNYDFIIMPILCWSWLSASNFHAC